MLYKQDYFDLQLKFAKIVSKRFGSSLFDALFSYTNVYLQLTLDFSFDQNNPIWKRFVVNFIEDPGYIYTAYLNAYSNNKIRDSSKISYGCFSYNYKKEDKTVKLHFSNKESSEKGPLSKEVVETRKGELQKMFKDIKKNLPEAEYVKGKSWLYSLDAYKRLFPNKFIKNLETYKGEEWQFMTRWGQFIDSGGFVKEKYVNEFLECVKTKPTIDDCKDCFPFKVFTSTVPIEVFYKEYVKT